MKNLFGMKPHCYIEFDKLYALHFSPCPTTPPWPDHPAQAKITFRIRYWNNSVKTFKSGGIQLESGEDNSGQYIHESIPDGLYSTAKFCPYDFPSGQVFQWLPKESMHHLCDSLFTFINLSHK